MKDVVKDALELREQIQKLNRDLRDITRNPDFMMMLLSQYYGVLKIDWQALALQSGFKEPRYRKPMRD